MKIALLVAYAVLSLYPPIELTRYIHAYQKAFGHEPQFKGELTYVWAAYFVALALVILLIWTSVENRRQ